MRSTSVNRSALKRGTKSCGKHCTSLRKRTGIYGHGMIQQLSMYRSNRAQVPTSADREVQEAPH